MTEQLPKYAFFYDKHNKTESFCSIWQARNYGTAKTDAEKMARKPLPKCIENFYMLEVKHQFPFGSFLSEVLSFDLAKFLDELKSYRAEDEIIEYDLKLFPVDESIMTAWSMTKGDVERLYVIRKYIEMCIERPRLYSFGQFQRLLSVIYEQEWHPRTLGFFAYVESETSGRYLFNDRELPKANYCIGANRLSDLDFSLKSALLGYDRGDFLPSPTVEVFEISSVVDAVLLSLFHLLQEHVAIKKCANCNRLFVPLLRADAIYCDRPAPQDSKKTCKEYGSKVLWYENIVNDDVAKLARNIYCAKQMLVKRNPDNAAYAEMFEYFKGEKKKWEQAVKTGEKTRKEFEEWLRTMKPIKTLVELEKSDAADR